MVYNQMKPICNREGKAIAVAAVVSESSPLCAAPICPSICTASRMGNVTEECVARPTGWQPPLFGLARNVAHPKCDQSRRLDNPTRDDTNGWHRNSFSVKIPFVSLPWHWKNENETGDFAMEIYSRDFLLHLSRHQKQVRMKMHPAHILEDDI